MAENEQPLQKRNLVLQVAIWAFFVGVAAGFAICWILFARDSDNKPIAASPRTQTRTVSPTRRTTPPAPEVPGKMTEFRDRVGESMLFKVTGVARGATIWGTDIYTDDSPLPITSIHFGALKPGEEGIIRVTILPGQDSYKSSTRHGVRSSSYEKWDGSYKLERVTDATTEPILNLPQRGDRRPDQASQTEPLLDEMTPATESNRKQFEAKSAIADAIAKYFKDAGAQAPASAPAATFTGEPPAPPPPAAEPKKD